MSEQQKYKETIKVNGVLLTKPYIASLNKEQREALIEPIFNEIRSIGWMTPDMDQNAFNRSYKRLCEYPVDTSLTEIYANTSLALDICKYFCSKSFYNSTEDNAPTMEEVFQNDEILKRVIYNRLGLGWYDTEPKETFNLTPKMLMYQGPRSMRLVPQISVFKPSIAKIIYSKYSEEGDVVFDYSAGFGCRALGALSCGRRYIGVDPLTTKEVDNMLNFLKIPKDEYKLVNGQSEKVKIKGETIDFAFSSPPYYNQEVYSLSEKQAYNKGEDYFYNVYWTKTVENCYNMLKKGKYFGLNITDSYPKMVEIAKEKFGDYKEIFKMRLTRSHLNKSGKDDATKYEPIYIFKK
jgi:hypothetical protein